ncbi:hypothetical protein FBU59_000732 [Linderina macrospora]|uniref:Uncharacterized protein n=1 Tax=Linderina macrospora TaxID=4868 RepID=A0ACC1JG43_9FUNG|nr:hypothetical protein FBU59_000732 [Linderina macrospora]
MNKVTLPSIPWIRTMDNDVVGDILYYFSTYHGRAMLRIVTEKLNAAYDAFKEQHPYFNGPISLVAHSLGGMICYEILYYQKLLSAAHKQHLKISQIAKVEHERYVELPRLKFTPTRLFTMGSPHGGTFVFRILDFDRYNIAPVGFHNIFHPYDPFGYRTEPLVDDAFADSPAVPVIGRPPVELDARRQSLTGSVAEFGRSLVDSAMTAPQTISSGMLKAARTSVTLPFTAVSSIIGNSGSSSHHHMPARSSTSPMVIGAAEYDTETKTKRRGRISSNIKGFFRSSKTTTVTVVNVKNATEEANQQQESAETQTSGEGHCLHNQLPGSNHTEDTPALDTSNPELARESPQEPPPEQAIGRRSHRPEDGGDLEMMSHLRHIFRPTMPPSEDQRLAETQGLPLSSRLMTIRRPKIRNTQTLPANLDEISPAVAVPDSESRPSNYRPDNSITPSNSNESSTKDGEEEESGIVGYLAASLLAYRSRNDGEEETELAGGTRRRNSSPPVPDAKLFGGSGSGDFGSWKPSLPTLDDDAVQDDKNNKEEEEEDTAVITSTETTVSGSEDMVSKLPYGERMDYIVPFSKKHLQNEYWLGLQAHFSYWTSKEVMFHIVFSMVTTSY